MSWARRHQGKGWLVAPHRLRQQCKEAQGAVAEGWDQSDGGGAGAGGVVVVLGGSPGTASDLA